MKTPKEWNTALSDRRKALHEEWLKDAFEIVQIYEADKQERVPFNILYSNTETLLPALYNSTPRPEVSARYSSSSRNRRLDAAVAQTAERTLEYTADTNSGRYETFDEATRDAVLQALVPGLGSTRVKFKEYAGGQLICTESIAFDRFLWGYSRKWHNVPWVAYGYDLNKEDFEELFPAFARKEDYKRLNWKEMEEKALQNKSVWDPDPEAKDKKREPTLLIWEVWVAAEKQVKFFCDQFEEELLKDEKYPFELTSRFPSPKPLQFLKRLNNLTPKPLYEEYREQAEELNDLTRRLKRVVKAIRVRGIYHPALAVVEDLFKNDSENALLPAEQAQVVADAGGLDKFIWLVPIEQLVNTALQLYDAREKCKATIYEIMGIGDVLRGQSVASETAKAQEIKNQWGSLRVKRMQKDVQVFCRDTFRIALEFAANLYSPLTFKQITCLPWLFQAEKQQIQQAQAAQQAQMQRQQAMMPPQGPPGPGQPPPQPPQPPPPIPGSEMLAFPAWEEVVNVLRGEFDRQYRMDIETNSTVDLEATEDKAAIGEFMNAFGQMTAGLAPMVESGQLPFEASKSILGETFRRFRFGRRVQDALEMMQQPQPKPDQQAIQVLHQAEIAKVQSEAKRQVGEMQETVLEMTGDIERLKTENKTLQAQITLTKAAADLTGLKKDVAASSREQQLRSTFKGTLDQQKKVADQKVQGAEQKAQGAEQKAAAAEQDSQVTQIEAKFAERENALQTQVQDMKEMIDAARQELKTKAEADDKVSKTEANLMARFEKSQQTFMDTMAKVAIAMTAKRQSRLETDPKTGKKVAISEVMQ